MSEVRVGGQAVIEGVMMRAGTRACVAVRRPDGQIETRQLVTRGWATSTARVPLIRGIAALAESLAMGIEALRWSEQRAVDEADARRPAPAWVLLALAVTAVVAMVVVVPALVAGAAPAGTRWFTLWETTSRLAIASGYLAVVGRRSDVRRVFEFHGAEHLVVGAHEAGRSLDAPSVQRGSIRHPRCGTSFLLVVSAVATAVHPFLPVEPVSSRLVARLVVVPVVAALAFEILALLGRAAASRPGGCVERLLLWPQRFTTRQPDDGQVEVAIAALRGALGAIDAPAGAGASTGQRPVIRFA